MSDSEPQDSTVRTYYMARPGELERFLAEAPPLTPEAAAKLRRLLPPVREEELTDEQRRALEKAIADRKARYAELMERARAVREART